MKYISIVINSCLLIILILLVISRLTQSTVVQGFNVLTGSMAPKIKPNSLVLVYQKKADKLKIGDVITYETEERSVLTHRIIEISEQDGERHFVTQGDSNETRDASIVKPEQIKGKVFISLPFLGRFGEIIQTKQGKMALMLTVLQIWLFMDVIQQIYQLSKQSKSNELIKIEE